MLFDNTYYYFKLRDGIEYAVKTTSFAINTAIMRGYREMTEEERTFYQENPNATVSEILAQELHTYTEPQTDLAKHKEEVLADIKAKMTAGISVGMLDYAMANACLAGTSLSYTGEKFYSTNDAKAVMKAFMDESYAAMTAYESYKTRINAASTKEAVDEIHQEVLNG